MSTSPEAHGWSDNSDALLWDNALAELGGHPLQSALWGDARHQVDGISDRRWLLRESDTPIALLRIERRKVPGIGTIGWIPKGPAGRATKATILPPAPLLRRDGMVLLIDDDWSEVETASNEATGQRRPQTIWIDLGAGKEQLWANLDKQWRYGVGRAARSGVSVDAEHRAGDVDEFHALCMRVSEKKGFDLKCSPALMQKLLEERGHSPIEARLFCARFEGRIGAGAFVIRCGKSLHYFWGATDRSASQARVGEAVQWAAIEWGLSKGCTRYDLEGVRPSDNSGTYAFKKKMGGRVVTLTGKNYHPLGLRGRLLARLHMMRTA